METLYSRLQSHGNPDEIDKKIANTLDKVLYRIISAPTPEDARELLYRFAQIISNRAFDTGVVIGIQQGQRDLARKLN